MTKRPGVGEASVTVKTCAQFLLSGLVAIWTLVAVGLAPGHAEAQTFSFQNVSVEGAERIELATILSFAAIPRGQPVTAGQLNGAYQRILASGLFSNVEIVPQGSTLVIRVEERPTINRIAFEGNRRIKDEDLAPLIQSQSRRVFSPSTAEADAQVIAQAYTQASRFAARVTPRIIRRSDNRVDLVFEIREGAVTEVERINIIGNSAYSDRRLRRVLGTKQAGLLRSVIRSDTFIEDRLAFDRQVIRDFYLSRGYVDFRVTSVNAEIAEERNGYFVTFNVQEGQQFRFGEITVNSDLPDADPDLFADALRIKPGVVYSPTLVEQSIARLERLANNEGLNFVRVDPRISRNDRDLTLDVEFSLTRGPRVFIERIDIEGNTTTLDRVVRRQFRVAEGDPFNPREIRESAERIRALGFFGNADVEAREGTTPDRVIIDVDVEEQPTGSIGFGGTYSSDTGFGANISFSERNFLGRGQALSFSFNTTSAARAYSFSFVEPAFLGRDVRFGLSLSYNETENENQTGYDTTVGSFVPYLAFPLTERSRLQLRYSGSLTDLSNPGDDVGGIIRSEIEKERLVASGLGYTYVFNTIGTGLDPTAGVRFSFGQDIYGLGGDVQSLRTTARLVGQRTVRNEEVTLRASLEGGALVTFGDDGSRIIDRFRLGSRQFRGFEPNGVGPREIGGDVNDALGGNLYTVAKFEAEFPLPLPQEYGISGGVFFDIGNLWGLDNTDVGTAGTQVLYDDGAWRSVIGASIFWDTAIGPLRFNFTEAIQAEKEDKPRAFEFTISTQF
ncbi:MAG: outer membrane protein assembly factor BamA [Marinovum sp.]|nr:outer membrane protein assembly factor BamA [Marinovum sp.]